MQAETFKVKAECLDLFFGFCVFSTLPWAGSESCLLSGNRWGLERRPARMRAARDLAPKSFMIADAEVCN
jgi:hypothetical protein